MIEVNFLRLKA